MSDAAASAARRPLIVLVCGASTLMTLFDMSIVNVSLGHMTGSLNATREEMTWVLTAYVIAMAIATPLTGWLSDKIGRRVLFISCVAGFTLTSVGCGLSTSLPELVAWRILQGAFAAPIGPISQAILLDVTPRERHGRAMAVFAMATMLGPTLGPVLGGWLTDSYGWRVCFLINLPLGAAMVAASLLCIRNATQSVKRRLDVIGYLALALAVGAFQLFLDRGPAAEWFAEAETWLWAALAMLGTYWFITHTLTTDTPLFSPELVRDRNFISAAALAFVICMVLLSSVTVVPPILQDVLGYPALDAGVSLIPRGIATIASAFIVGRLVARLDARLIIFVGITLTAAGLLMMSGVSPQSDYRLVMWSNMVLGVGQGTFFVPITTIAFSSLAPHLRTEAAAAVGVIRALGTSVGISAVASMQAAAAYRAQASLGEHLTPERLSSLQVTPAPGAVANMEIALLARELARQAELIAHVHTLQTMALVCALASPLLLLLRYRR